jgi:hypothetical protein
LRPDSRCWLRSVGRTGGTAGFGEIRCGRWATATSDRTTRDPGQPGVRLHCYLDVRQEINTQSPARCCSALTCCGRAGSRVRTRTRFADGRAGWKAWGCDAGAAGTDARRPCDGFRALVSVDAGRVVLRSRRGTEMLPAFPEIGAEAAQLPDATALDGELVGDRCRVPGADPTAPIRAGTRPARRTESPAPARPAPTSGRARCDGRSMTRGSARPRCDGQPGPAVPLQADVPGPGDGEGEVPAAGAGGQVEDDPPHEAGSEFSCTGSASPRQAQGEQPSTTPFSSSSASVRASSCCWRAADRRQ